MIVNTELIESEERLNMTVDELIEYLSTFPSSAALRINGEQDISLTLKCINDEYYVNLCGINSEVDK